MDSDSAIVCKWEVCKTCHADDLIAGHELELFLDDKEIAVGNQVCVITKVENEDPYMKSFIANQAKQAEYSDLRDRGAAGDTEAAIAYCKLEVQGLVNHSAMG